MLALQSPQKGSISSQHCPGILSCANGIWPFHFLHCQSVSLLLILLLFLYALFLLAVPRAQLYPSQAALIAERLNHHKR